MPAQIAAMLDHDTVRQLLSEVLPLTVDLGDESHKDRWIVIDPPQLLEFVPAQGIRVQTSAKLHWTVAGVGVPFTVNSIRLLLKPVVDAAKARLNLVIKLEETDLANVPKMIDRSVVTQLNARLEGRPDVLGWNFGKTLAIRLALSEKMAPLEAFEMNAGAMGVEVSRDALRIDLALPMQFLRRAAAPASTV